MPAWPAWPCRQCVSLAERSATLRRAVGLFDVATVVLAVGVCGSLGLLAWTLGVGSLRAVRHARREVKDARMRLAAADRQLHARSGVIHDTLTRLLGDGYR